MGLIGFVKEFWKVPSSRLEEDTEENRVSYNPDFFERIVWECPECGSEMGTANDNSVACVDCFSEYFFLSEDDFPDPIRASCLRCGEVSEDISGFRSENIRFSCPCGFRWKSSRW